MEHCKEREGPLLETATPQENAQCVAWIIGTESDTDTENLQE